MDIHEYQTKEIGARFGVPIVSAIGDTAQERGDLLVAAGVTVAPDPASMGRTVAEVLRSAGLLAAAS